MPCSVFAEMKTASLCWHWGQRTSLVRGSVGSAVTSDTTYAGAGGRRGEDKDRLIVLALGATHVLGARQRGVSRHVRYHLQVDGGERRIGTLVSAALDREEGYN